MPRQRAALTALALLGLALSVWSARPADPSDIAGWRSALLWASLGWGVILVGILPWAPLPAIAAGILMAAAVEVLVLVMHDPLLVAAKPLYQLPPLIVCVLLGFSDGKNASQRT